MDNEKPKTAVVIGGGYIGLEMAEALIMRGLDVSLVDRGAQVMNTLDPDMGALVSDALVEAGVKLYREEALEAFEVAHGRVKAVVTNKRTLPADIVILGLGVRPNTELAAGAEIPLGVRGAIKVNDRMQTDIPGVWAAGDCAESFHLVSRRPVHIALGTIANKQGRVAGINLGGGYATFPGVVGTAASKICKWEVARTGLQEHEIRAIGSGTCRGQDREHHPGELLSQRGTYHRKGPGRERQRAPAGRSDRGDRRGGKTDRHLRHGPACRHVRPGDDQPGPQLRPSLLECLGPRPHRRPPGGQGRPIGFLKRRQGLQDKTRGDRVPGFFSSGAGRDGDPWAGLPVIRTLRSAEKILDSIQ